jgi:hypothetical protein
MSGLSLYVIEDALLELAAAREELTDRLAAEEAASMADAALVTREELAEVEKAIALYATKEPKKVDNIHALLSTWRITEEVAKQDAREAASRAARIEAARRRLSQMVVDIMAAAGKKRIEGTGGRALVRRGNGGLAPLNIQEDILPDTWRDVVVRMPMSFWKELTKGRTAEQMPGEGCVKVLSTEPAGARIRLGLQVQDIPGAHLLERGESLLLK